MVMRLIPGSASKPRLRHRAPDACLTLSRWLSGISERSSSYVVILVYIVTLFGGTLLMWRAIGPRALRWFASVAYVALGGTFLLFYAFAFVCLVFHDCL